MAKFQIQRGNGAQPYFYHLRATGNNEIILRGENYSTKQACQTAIASVKANAPYDGRYDRLYSVNRQYYFNLSATNGEIIGTSETYASTTNREYGITLVKNQAPTASVEDLT